MGSAYKRYRKDSPEAIASVLAALLVGDGRLDPAELAFMDEMGLFGIVGVPRETFLRVAGEMYASLGRGRDGAIEHRVARSARLDAALDAVASRERQLLVAAALLYLAGADRVVDEEEIVLVRQVFERWNVTAGELERELNVPRQRTRPFFDAARVGAT